MDFVEGTRRPWLLKYGDVIKWLDARNTKLIKLKPGKRIQTVQGYVRHESIAGVMSGTPVYDHRGKEFRKPFRASAEDWTENLSHRTQIVYAPDIAAVTAALRLKPGHVVLESGTGSASATHSFARAVAPTGRVYTFEFNAGRADAARKELACTGIGNGKAGNEYNGYSGSPAGAGAAAASTSTSTSTSAIASEPDPFRPAGPCGRLGGPLAVSSHGDASQGFPAGLSEPSPAVDAVFLDLPAPWLAIPHAGSALKHGGRICCFSPCIEQVQRNCAALARAGFVDLDTVEVLGVEYVVEAKLAHVPVLRMKGADGKGIGLGVVEGQGTGADGATSSSSALSSSSSGASASASSRKSHAAVAPAPPGFRAPLRAVSEAAAAEALVKSERFGRSLFPKSSQSGHTAYLTFGTRHRAEVVREAWAGARALREQQQQQQQGDEEESRAKRKGKGHMGQGKQKGQGRDGQEALVGSKRGRPGEEEEEQKGTVSSEANLPAGDQGGGREENEAEAGMAGKKRKVEGQD